MERVLAEISALRRENAEWRPSTEAALADLRRDGAEIRAELADLRREGAEIRAELADLRRDGAEIRAELGALRRDLQASAVETRRHFEVVVEGLRHEVGLVAEGHTELDSRLTALATRTDRGFDEVGGQMLHLRADLGLLRREVSELRH
jgi:chromosome segregation ATPase